VVLRTIAVDCRLKINNAGLGPAPGALGGELGQEALDQFSQETLVSVK